jgi:hypothetical protein
MTMPASVKRGLARGCHAGVVWAIVGLAACASNGTTERDAGQGSDGGSTPPDAAAPVHGDGGVEAAIGDATIPDAARADAPAASSCADGDVECGPSTPAGTGNYFLNAPDPCASQFFATGCVSGNAASACGGHCTVANACSPPEDPGKANLTKTFICPRFLLFGAEMSQAAADDTPAGRDPSDPPFNYAVAGHDPDTGGLDPGASSSCCQCYQLVFETPESGSPQPPALPIPKPLVVQSVNTAAGGPMNFDLFMGAGGFGAYDACVADPGFGGTSSFGDFMYDTFPTDSPNNGGVKFLNQSACVVNGSATVATLQSAACQTDIASLCDEATSAASPAMASSTRASCARSNAFASLYHQNWKVRAKKVECPVDLTRVTGCRLEPSGLPAPDPTVATVADTDATWRTGYTTTTMQDCCKPTCAWQDNVAGKGLVPSGAFSSFYSCDQTGTPLTTSM